MDAEHLVPGYADPGYDTRASLKRAANHWEALAAVSPPRVAERLREIAARLRTEAEAARD